MALQRIGARGSIASLTENSPNAIKVNTVWDMIFQEVLSERDWKFAKIRVQLQQNANLPAGGYKFAYPLPSDFLRLCKPREVPENRRFRYADSWGAGFGGGDGGFCNRDVPVWPREVDPYVVETVLNAGPPPTYTTNLLTNYPFCNTYSTVCPITINYIRLITDLTQLLPGFVNCLANRIAAELAIAITEDKQKAQGFMEVYMSTLNSAQAQQECDDFLKDESGSQSWIHAGRRVGYY